MLVEEAVWIRNTLKSQFRSEDYPLLNIGSSTFDFRSKTQPQIHDEVFLPLEQSGLKVYHTDIKRDNGVDLVGDLNDPDFRKHLNDLGVRSVLCSNLLEHLSDPHVICRSIMETLPSGGLLLVTVPYYFPFHKDPIDTMLRPNVSELAGYFPGAELLASEIVETNSSLRTVFANNRSYMFLMIVRYALPFYKFNEWVKMIKDLFKINRKFSATCVLLRKK